MLAVGLALLGPQGSEMLVVHIFMNITQSLKKQGPLIYKVCLNQ